MGLVLQGLGVSATQPFQDQLDQWEPVISGLVAADRGDTVADRALDLILASLAEHADWRQVVAVLRRIRTGERDPALVTGLDSIDTAIVRRALAALAGTVPVDANAWRAGYLIADKAFFHLGPVTKVTFTSHGTTKTLTGASLAALQANYSYRAGDLR